MGRGPGDPGGGIDESARAASEPEQSGAAARLWEEVRRALGRLVSHAVIYRLSEAQMSPQADVFAVDTTRGPDVCTGAQESGWRIGAQVTPNALPSAEAGGDNIDLAAVAARVSANALLGTAMTPVYALAVRPGADEVRVAQADIFRLTVPSIGEESTFPAGGDVQQWDTAAPEAPDIQRLTVAAPSLSRTPGAQNTGERQILRPAGGRVRPGTSMMADLPLRRSALPRPLDIPVAQAFLAERQRLAASARASLDDVQLIGVYPNIPVAAVRKLSVEEAGQTLCVWLKPERRGAALMTVVIGRRRSTGSMLQTVLAE